MRIPISLAATVLAMCFASTASASSPEEIRFHGVIAELGGQAPSPGVYEFTVRFYDIASGGTPLLTLPTTSEIAAGAYALALSTESNGELSNVFSDSPIFVEITVDTGPGGASVDQILHPRQKVASTPYALRATRADLADAAPPPTGHCNGEVVVLSDSLILLRPYNSGNLEVEVDGKLLSQVGELVFDVDDATHMENPKIPSTFYFLYIEDDNGTMKPHISQSGPSNGYSTTLGSDVRYVGDLYVDSDSNVAMVEHNPLSGEYQFHLNPFGTQHVADKSPTTIYRDSISLAGLVPGNARKALLQVRVRGDDSWIHIASAPAATGKSVSEFAGIQISTSQDSVDQSNDMMFWLTIDGSDPKIAYTVSNGAAEEIQFHVIGWQSLR